MYHFIYITINIHNWKFYIGKHSTDNLDDGYLGSGYYLKDAIKKHGKDSFRRLDLEFFNSEQEVLSREREMVSKDFLVKYRGHCYNIGCGGFGGDNISKHPERSKIIKKMSRIMISKWSNEEYHYRVQKRRHESMKKESHRALRSNIAKDLWNTESYRNKTTEGTRMAQNNEEFRKKRSDASKKKWENPNYRAKIMKTLTSEEHRKKASIATKKLFKERPEVLQKIIENGNITRSTKEYKEKASMASKLRWMNNSKLRESLTVGRMGSKNPTYESKWMYNPNTKMSTKVQKENVNKFLENGWHFGRILSKNHKYNRK